MDTYPLQRSGFVVIGVDTHEHIHVAAILDSAGGVPDTMSVATDRQGFEELLNWAATFGTIIAFGIEGTGSYGASLASSIRRQSDKVIEVSRQASTLQCGRRTARSVLTTMSSEGTVSRSMRAKTSRPRRNGSTMSASSSVRACTR